MPGSVTIGHFHPSVTLGHDDAERLEDMLARMSAMLDSTGPDRITDAQIDALCAGQADGRSELATWTDRLTHRLQAHL
ncbi:hypothetical protein GXW83_11815 [Streptacidiphilus sp. PB12-B1b]|uniref:hypothetical protein n=1 Tax=Streptacidiphilus sp. PB12-B1b TaxID=2705012 RepID=UPI0015F9EC1B|nr:hypothetical protein [Streptacidiphilus sp. PB12-B1b]QMU76327.1 hypothetical protein GXW83_11815 [Streptacidiphilus sp. PB12-B1b]